MNEDHPTDNWPEKSGEYKVVQFMINDKPYLRFSDKDYTHHSIIVKTFIDFEIDDYIKKYDDIGMLFPLEGINYKLPGMGFAKIDVEKKTAHFDRISGDYEIGIDGEHLRLIKNLYNDWDISYSEKGSTKIIKL